MRVLPFRVQTGEVLVFPGCGATRTMSRSKVKEKYQYQIGMNEVFQVETWNTSECAWELREVMWTKDYKEQSWGLRIAGKNKYLKTKEVKNWKTIPSPAGYKVGTEEVKRNESDEWIILDPLHRPKVNFYEVFQVSIWDNYRETWELCDVMWGRDIDDSWEQGESPWKKKIISRTWGLRIAGNNKYLKTKEVSNWKKLPSPPGYKVSSEEINRDYNEYKIILEIQTTEKSRKATEFIKYGSEKEWESRKTKLCSQGLLSWLEVKWSKNDWGEELLVVDVHPISGEPDIGLSRRPGQLHISMLFKEDIVKAEDEENLAKNAENFIRKWNGKLYRIHYKKVAGWGFGKLSTPPPPTTPSHSEKEKKYKLINDIAPLHAKGKYYKREIHTSFFDTFKRQPTPNN